YLNAAWWYFSMVIQFYLIFPLLFWAARKFGAWIFLLIACALGFFVRYLMLDVYPQDGLWILGGFAICRLPEFALGMSLGMWHGRVQFAFNRWCRVIDFARSRTRQNRRSRRRLFLRPLSHSSALRHLAWASDSTTTNLDLHIHLSHHGSGPERVGNCFGEGNQRTDKQTSFGEKDRTPL